jgi:outer membrane protein assembly factor BamB
MPLGGYDAAQPPPRPDQRQPIPQVYEESSYHPPRRDPTVIDQPPYDEYYDDDLPPRRWPWVLLSLILLAGALLAASYFFIPKDAKGILGQAKTISSTVVDGGLNLLGLKKSEPPRLIKFDTPEYLVQTGVKTVFTFTADKTIDGIRILDEVGSEIKGVAEPMDAPNNTTWTLTAILDRPMTTLLSAGILSDKTWYQTDKTVQLTVAEPTATPLPATPTPTLEPTAQPTPAPTAASSFITQEPVLPADSQASGLVVAPVVTQTPATLVNLLPAFSPVPQASTPTPEFQAEEFPQDMLAELPEGELPQDMLAELPEEELPQDMLAEFPGDEIPGDMPSDDPSDSLTQSAEQQLFDPADETAQAAPTAEPLPTMSPMPVLTVLAAEQQAPGKLGITEAAYQGSRRQSDYQRATPINAQGGELYTYYPGGVFTFRSDGMRQNAAFGTADMPLEQMSIHWQTELGSLRTADGTLYGLGWTGQPAIVKWSVEVRSGMNISDEKKDVKALKEVIFAAQDGKVYFLDLADGQPTREPIDVGYPLKGSVAVDAFGRPLIAFGQGVSIMPNKTGDIGYYFYNLIDQSQAYFINGRRTKNQLQYATNGAFDGTGLFERNSDSLIVGGENGLLYTVKLNTVFDFKNPTSLTISPETVYLRSKGSQQDTTVSIESSPAVYGQYAFYADKQGILRCVDTTTMQTLWAFDNGDNTDAAPALDLNDDNSLALYTGTTVHARSRRDGNAMLRRIDALTGEQAWAVEIKAGYDATERGGLKASPVVGQGQISELVIFTVNLTEEGGAVIALNKEDGSQVWKVPVPSGAISSPVAVYAQDGRARIVQADLDGRLHLIDGLSGSVLSTLDLGGAIEGSPAVYNDILVIGTSSRDNNRMYGIRLE